MGKKVLVCPLVGVRAAAFDGDPASGVEITNFFYMSFGQVVKNILPVRRALNVSGWKSTLFPMVLAELWLSETYLVHLYIVFFFYFS